MTTAINTVAILGGGQMGGGIAHVCALAGLSTHVYDSHAHTLENVVPTIAANLRRQEKKGVIDAAQAAAALERIATHDAPGDWLGEAGAVIEAVTENRSIKHELYRAVDPHLSDETIFASNTSSYSITELAAHTRRPEYFIGMHFMNPPPMMPLVEIISGAQTAPAVTEQTTALARQLGKETVHANDYPGFITNRILMPMINEAIFTLFEGVGGVADIDNAMQLGMRHPMGPLTLADFIGLDTCLEVLNVLYTGIGDQKFRPCPLLKKMVAAGCLGKKSGVGFYDHHGESPVVAAMFNK